MIQQTLKFFSCQQTVITDKFHVEFFLEYLSKINDSHQFEEAISSWKWERYIPVSDFLHLLKTARAHLLNHAMKLNPNRPVLDLELIKRILDIGEALDDKSHWAKMSDVFAIALFQFTSFYKLTEEAKEEAAFDAPFTFINESIRSTALSIGDRIKLLEAAFLILKWHYKTITESSDRKWLPEFSEGCDGTLIGSKIFIIRCMNLCFAIGASLKHFQYIPLDRIWTHVLENYFGFIRLASKNKHTVPEVLQNLKNNNLSLFSL